MKIIIVFSILIFDLRFAQSQELFNKEEFDKIIFIIKKFDLNTEQKTRFLLTYIEYIDKKRLIEKNFKEIPDSINLGNKKGYQQIEAIENLMNQMITLNKEYLQHLLQIINENRIQNLNETKEIYHRDL